MEYNNQNESPALDLTQEMTNLERASLGKRFANYIIDLLAFYFLAFCYGMFIAIVSPSTVEGWDQEDATGFDFTGYLISMVLFFLYMSLLEVVFKGRSLGKLITGTKAVNEDGTNITVKTAFLRGLCRIVPFEPFSAFGRAPWHDSWTNTQVIDINKSTLPSQPQQ